MPNSWYLQPLKGISGDFCGRQRLKPRKSVAIAQIWDYVRKILHETSGNYFIVHQILSKSIFWLIMKLMIMMGWICRMIFESFKHRSFHNSLGFSWSLKVPYSFRKGTILQQPFLSYPSKRMDLKKTKFISLRFPGLIQRFCDNHTTDDAIYLIRLVNKG
jgi:hypothetical protein